MNLYKRRGALTIYKKLQGLGTIYIKIIFVTYITIFFQLLFNP